MKALLSLFLAFPQNGDEDERKLKFDVYWEILAPLTPEAIIATCRAGCRGEIGNPEYLPSAAVLYRHGCQRIPAPRPMALPAPPRHSDEHIARVSRGLKLLALALKAGEIPPAADLLARS